MQVNVGDSVRCAETGKQFVIQQEGCTFNYATDRQGNSYSDEGVDIREKRSLLDRSKPFLCYISTDGKHVTGWKGNVLGTVYEWWTIKLSRRSFTHGAHYRHIKVRDVHGGLWYGRSSPGVVVTLRPVK
jgi:hypothetical protein